MNEKKKGGRPRTGYLEFRGKQWCAQLTVKVDGESVRRWFPLGTDSRTVAKRKLARLLAEHETGAARPTAAAKCEETVTAFAEPWLDARERRGLPSAKNERRYFERVWKPALGQLPLSAVRASIIQSVLNECADGGVLRVDGQRYSRESVQHIRATILRCLEAAWREELITENVAKRTTVPEIEETRKARAVLTDAEIREFVSRPDVDAEIKLLVLISRTVGGMRTGDLNSLDWTAFSPGFATCTFVRRKTRKKKPAPQCLEVPAAVRPFLAAWHERHGLPPEGPVFPVRRGERAGERKAASKQSYAIRLRRELLRAGIDRHELHHETATTLPVDFHSMRRASASALARVGVNEQTAMILTGHSDPKVHMRYVEAATIRALPTAALPELDSGAAALVANDCTREGAKLVGQESRSDVIFRSGRRDLNPRRPPWQER
jgi:integrase